jgi:uncharacterized protein YgiM (DUF1202 family)
MKITYWRILAVSLGLAAPAAWADDQLPPSAGKAPSQPAPKLEAVKPAVTPTPAPSAEPITGAGPAVVRQNNVNVRGKAAINSEVLTRLTRGQQVTVLEEVTLKKPKQDEPAKWAKIALPTNAAVWAHSSFIDPTAHTVIPRRLNLRSGPSENHSIVGRIEKGAAVKVVDQKGEWVKVEPPADAYGFVAAHLLAKESAPAIAAVTPPAPAESTPPPIETAVPTTPPPAPATDPTVAATPVPPPAETVTPIPTPAPDPVPVPPPAPEEDPFVKRVVTREGIVERSVSIQAPSHFILQALDNKRAINYLFSPTTNVMLKDYRGQRIVVTGEELLDERWPNTPVIQVDKIETVP